MNPENIRNLNIGKCIQKFIEAKTSFDQLIANFTRVFHDLVDPDDEIKQKKWYTFIMPFCFKMTPSVTETIPFFFGDIIKQDKVIRSLWPFNKIKDMGVRKEMFRKSFLKI